MLPSLFPSHRVSFATFLRTNGGIFQELTPFTDAQNDAFLTPEFGLNRPNEF
jgi:hypothetical protein